MANTPKLEPPNGRCYVWLAQLFLHIFLGLTLTGPKKASKRTILHNRLNKGKKLLVDVANLAPCCHDDYDVLLEVLGTLGKCYVSNPVAKTLVWIENHDWHNCFCMSSWGSPLLDPKKLQNEQFYIIDWIRKNPWSMLPIWLLAAMMMMMYYWWFWEPWANAMLAILLAKLWFGLKIMTGTTVFACLPGAHPYWTQKSFKTNSFT